MNSIMHSLVTSMINFEKWGAVGAVGIAIIAVAWICFVVWFLIQILDILKGALS